MYDIGAMSTRRCGVRWDDNEVMGRRHRYIKVYLVNTMHKHEPFYHYGPQSVPRPTCKIAQDLRFATRTDRSSCTNW